MSDPGDTTDRPADQSHASSSQPAESLSASSGDSGVDSMWEALIEYQKQANTDAREDRRMSRDAYEAMLRAKAGRPRLDNESIEAGMQEAGEKAEHAMSSATKGLIMGIISCVLVVIGAATWMFGQLEDGTAGEISSLWSPGAGSLAAGIEGVSNALPSSPDSDGESVEAAPPASSACTISFVDFPSPGDVPASGPFTFNWTDVPEAATYSVQVSRTTGAGAPWIVTEKDNSKTMYMENFPTAGEYEISASAVTESGEVLCSAVHKFTKDAADDPAEKSRDDGGGSTCFDPNKPENCQ